MIHRWPRGPRNGVCRLCGLIRRVLNRGVVYFSGEKEVPYAPCPGARPGSHYKGVK